MSTAYYPQGMRTMPASGRMNGSLPSQYKTWKGSGVFSNPAGIATSDIRPLTNKDSGNVFQSGSFPARYPQFTRRFIPRPLKQYRRGRVIPPNAFENPYPDNPVFETETALINYNVNRFVPSSKGMYAGHGRYGYGLVTYTQDIPGGYIVKENNTNNHTNKLDKDCKSCEGVGLVVNYMPNNSYLTDNPEARSQTPGFCCNEQRKAKRRAIYASTNLKKNYYTRNFEYLQNRCKTFQQKSFNFQDNKEETISALQEYGYTQEQIASAKPGSPLTQLNIYQANCYPNVCYPTISGSVDDIHVSYQGCKATVYKPNNPQFAKQGAVSSSTRTLKLDVDVISTNAASLNKNNNVGHELYNANELYRGRNNYVANLYKNKSQEKCSAPPPSLTQGKYRYQNKKQCNYTKTLPTYQVPISKPSTYRYYPSTVFPNGHYVQHPRTYPNPSKCQEI